MGGSLQNLLRYDDPPSFAKPRMTISCIEKTLSFQNQLFEIIVQRIRIARRKYKKAIKCLTEIEIVILANLLFFKVFEYENFIFFVFFKGKEMFM